jgi:hypothetical protein
MWIDTYLSPSLRRRRYTYQPPEPTRNKKETSYKQPKHRLCTKTSTTCTLQPCFPPPPQKLPHGTHNRQPAPLRLDGAAAPAIIGVAAREASTSVGGGGCCCCCCCCCWGMRGQRSVVNVVDAVNVNVQLAEQLGMVPIVHSAFRLGGESCRARGTVSIGIGIGIVPAMHRRRRSRRG